MGLFVVLDEFGEVVVGCGIFFYFLVLYWLIGCWLVCDFMF